MCTALLKLDIYTAFRSNIAIMLLLPIWLVIFIQQSKKYIIKGKNNLTQKQNVILWVTIAILLLFGIIRNIPFMQYLNYKG